MRCWALHSEFQTGATTRRFGTDTSSSTFRAAATTVFALSNKKPRHEQLRGSKLAKVPKAPIQGFPNMRGLFLKSLLVMRIIHCILGSIVGPPFAGNSHIGSVYIFLTPGPGVELGLLRFSFASFGLLGTTDARVLSGNDLLMLNSEGCPKAFMTVCLTMN